MLFLLKFNEIIVSITEISILISQTRVSANVEKKWLNDGWMILKYKPTINYDNSIDIAVMSVSGLRSRGKFNSGLRTEKEYISLHIVLEKGYVVY